MSGKQDAYGNSGGGDTDFRKTWDREEMAKKAQIREKKEREEAKERYEAKLAGKTYRRRASTPEDLKNIEARTDRIDYKSMIGKTSLVPAGAGVGRRGKSAGIYCAVCDETYRDNIAYIEHTNSQRHLVASGLSNTVERANVAQVHERLRYLKRKREEEAAAEILDLDTRLEVNKEQMDREAEERRRKRNERRRKKPAADSNAMVWNVEGDGIIS